MQFRNSFMLMNMKGSFYSKEKFEEFLQIVSYVILLGLVKKIIKLNNRERPIRIEDFKRIVELLSNYLQLLKKTAQETSFYFRNHY